MSASLINKWLSMYLYVKRKSYNSKLCLCYYISVKLSEIAQDNDSNTEIVTIYLLKCSKHILNHL